MLTRAAGIAAFGSACAGHAWRTFWVTMVGFGISIVVGTLLGVLVGSSRLACAGLAVVGAMAMYELFAIIEKRTTGRAHRGTRGG